MLVFAAGDADTHLFPLHSRRLLFAWGVGEGGEGGSAAPTRLLMNHFVATAASAHINTASMRCILF